MELKVTVSFEEEHTLAIVYNVGELALMRRDMSDISSNCGMQLFQLMENQ
jgi:hypothetical protein